MLAISLSQPWFTGIFFYLNKSVSFKSVLMVYREEDEVVVNAQKYNAFDMSAAYSK